MLWPGPQTQAATTEAFETLYGGEAGGGKTELIAWLAKNQHHSSLVLRRSFPELERTLIPRMLEKYPDPRRYNQSNHVWRLADGQRIELSYLDNQKDVFKFQGTEIDGFFPDELTQFPRDWYLYIFSRLRTTRRGQRTRCLATSNPGGEYEAWVKQRWAAWLDRRHPNPAASGELRWYRRVQSEADYAEEEIGEEIGRADPLAWSRTFIRAGLKDNPALGKEYRRMLDMQPEPYRSQLMLGDWEIGSKDDAWQLIQTAWVLLAQERWKALACGIDVAVWLAAYVAGKLPEGIAPNLLALLQQQDWIGLQNAGKLPTRPVECYGADIARGGKDRTVIVPRLRNVVLLPTIRPGKETPDGQSVVMIMATMPDADTARWQIDVIGVGSSAVDIAIQNSFEVVAMNGSEGSIAKAKDGKLGFVNQRAEWHWKLREALDPTSGEDMALPPLPEMLADLTAPRWKMMARGIQIEAKEDIIERIGRSPDVGDATINAVAVRFGHGEGFFGFIKKDTERLRTLQAARG